MKNILFLLNRTLCPDTAALTVLSLEANAVVTRRALPAPVLFREPGDVL